jgi:DNA-directed RNA polymerase subunit RPC12/RpoP
MYYDKVDIVHKCFRCGDVPDDIEQDDATGLMRCGNCGELSVLPVVAAYDLINDLYLRGILTFTTLEGDEDGYYLSYDVDPFGDEPNE